MEFWKKTRKKRPDFVSFGKNCEEKNHSHGVFEKTRKKTTTLGALEKTKIIRRRPNPCFLLS
jgi:hypothetical protein